METNEKYPRGCTCCVISALCIPTIVILVVGFLFAKYGMYQPTIPPAAPLPSPNGFDNIVTAGNMLKANGGTTAIYVKNSSSVSLEGEKLVASKNQATLVELRKAFRIPCRVPMPRELNAAFPYLSNTRDLARLLQADAEVHMHHGDYSGAFRNGEESLQLGNDIMQGGSYIHGLVGIACSAIGQRYQLIALDHLSISDCAAYLPRLQKLIHDTPSSPDIMKEDRAFTLTILTNLKSPDDLSLVHGDQPPTPLSEWGLFVWRMRRDRSIKDLDTYYAGVLANCSKPATLRSPISLPTSEFADIVGPLNKELHRFDEGEAHNRLLLAALAIRRYKLQHGRLPDTISQSGLPNDLTTDPYNGKQIIYKPSGGNYLLYCVGPDGKDDGGVPQDEADRENPGDIGLRDFIHRKKGRMGYSYRLVPHMKPPILKKGWAPLLK